MSLINQRGRLFSSHFRQKVQIEREGKASDLTAIVIPTSPNDVLFLPESERYLPSIKIFTLEPLERGDFIHYRGEVYCLKTLANWGDYGYYYHIAVRHIPTAKSHSGGFEVT